MGGKLAEKQPADLGDPAFILIQFVIGPDHGIDAFFSVLRTVCTLDEALDVRNAAANLRATSRQVFRLWSTAHGVNAS